MGTILQVAPVVDSVTSGASELYSNQLQSSGGVGLVTFIPTDPSSSLLIYPGGAVAVTGNLEVGSYSVSGTMSDTHGNSGIWTFTLAVTANISPQTSVVRVVSQPPTGTELLVPFQVDPATGAFAKITDYAQILSQHILTIIMTAQTERVMISNYGVGLEHRVFSPISDQIISFDESDIIDQIQLWEPAVQVYSVQVYPNPQAQNQLNVTVEWSIRPLTDKNSLTVTVGGSLQQVVAP